MTQPIDNLENGMLLYHDEEDSDYTYEEYLADEADRLWKEKQIEEGFENGHSI